MGVGDAAPLEVGEVGVELEAQLADLVAVDGLDVAAVVEDADGGDDGGGAGAEDLLHLALLTVGHQVVDGELLLADGVAPLPEDGEHGVPGDAGEDGALAGGGPDFAVDLEHDVHAADFLDVLALLAVQPQNLAVAHGLGLLLADHGAGVVAAALGKAGAALDGADVLILDEDLHRVDALGVVSAGGGADDAEEELPGVVQGELAFGGEHKGPDVQRGAGLGGNPVGVHRDDSLDGLDEHLLGEGRHAQPVVGVDHPAGVHLGPEELNLALGGAVGLEALEGLLGVVEGHRAGVHGDGAVGDDAGVMPADALGVVHQEHVVGHIFAKPQRLLIGLFLGVGGFGDFDIHGGIPPK